MIMISELKECFECTTKGKEIQGSLTHSYLPKEGFKKIKIDKNV